MLLRGLAEGALGAAGAALVGMLARKRVGLKSTAQTWRTLLGRVTEANQYTCPESCAYHSALLHNIEHCFILYCIYCIVLLHRVLLHIALLHIVLSVSDNGGGSRQATIIYGTICLSIEAILRPFQRLTW